MRKEIRHCEQCVDDTEHTMVGLVPVTSIEFTNDFAGGSEKENYWYMVSTCGGCGGVHIVPPTDDQVYYAQDRVIKTMVESGVLSGEEAQEYLDG